MRYFSIQFHKQHQQQMLKYFFYLSRSLNCGMIFLFLFAKNICTKRKQTKKKNENKRKKNEQSNRRKEKPDDKERKTLYIVCSNNSNKQMNFNLSLIVYLNESILCKSSFLYLQIFSTLHTNICKENEQHSIIVDNSR